MSDAISGAGRATNKSRLANGSRTPIATDFQHVVVGAGPMGASAAKYLAESGARVLLLAPEEPAGSAGSGRYSSHGDHSRITRSLDSHPVWARLAKRSIDRYRRIEGDSGVSFFNDVGCLTIFEGAKTVNRPQVEAVEAIAAAERVEHRRLTSADLERDFAWLSLPEGCKGFHETRNAGWVSPRDFVRAQITVGMQHGLEVCREPAVGSVVERNRVSVETPSGQRFRSENALFAMGMHTVTDFPVVVPAPLKVFARTFVHVPLTEQQATGLADLPSLIVRGVDDRQNCYVIPPVRYPDGRYYIKIGGGRREHSLETGKEIIEWFASQGDMEVRATLLQHLGKLIPSTRAESGQPQACAITVTESGLPLIKRAQRRVGVLTAGNGHAAKSGDEIGRVGADMILGREDWDRDYDRAFSG